MHWTKWVCHKSVKVSLNRNETFCLSCHSKVGLEQPVPCIISTSALFSLFFQKTENTTGDSPYSGFSFISIEPGKEGLDSWQFSPSVEMHTWSYFITSCNRIWVHKLAFQTRKSALFRVLTMVFISLICTVQDSKDIVLALTDEEMLWRGKHIEEKDCGRWRRWRGRLSEIEQGHCLSGG